MSKIVRGTMLLTMATFLSRFLGMIYVIPFNELVGAQGGALYYYAYNSYNIMLSVAVVGVPTAMSKFVSKYNSLGDYRTSMRMLRTSMFIMGATGLICFLALFFGSGFLAQIIIADGDQHGNTVNDVICHSNGQFCFVTNSGDERCTWFFSGQSIYGADSRITSH